MIRSTTLALVALLLSGTAAGAAADERHSGRVVDVRPDGTLVLEEQGPWTGPGTGLIQRTVRVQPGTAVRVLQPTGQWNAGDAMPGYAVRAVEFRDLAPGDFVTAVMGGDGRAAVALDVMRPDGADAGLASPPLRSGGTIPSGR